MRRLGKKQLEAMAWLSFSQGGTWDHNDVVTAFEDARDNERTAMEARLTDDDIEWIADRVGELRCDLEDKAKAKMSAAFKKRARRPKSKLAESYLSY